ncbi:MAG: hypothetical protein U0412_13460 [Nitrospira sp.]
MVVITPEYNPTAYRADYWMPLRPESDGALFIGAMKIIVDENMHDMDFEAVHGCPDPGADGYAAVPGSAGRGAELSVPGLLEELPGRMQSLKPEQIERLGGMMVWDLNKKAAVPCIVSRWAGTTPTAASMRRSTAPIG